MYIILNNKTNKYAVIKDKTEIAGYINQPVRTIRRLLKQKYTVVIGDYTIITPDYIQSKSNSGGKRYPKERGY